MALKVRLVLGDDRLHLKNQLCGSELALENTQIIEVNRARPANAIVRCQSDRRQTEHSAILLFGNLHLSHLVELSSFREPRFAGVRFDLL